MAEEKLKQTQGQLKTRRRLKELFENEVFKNELNEILAIPNARKRDKQIRRLAEEYFLEYSAYSPLVNFIADGKLDLERLLGFDQDVCQIYDEEDEYLNPNFPLDFDIPPSRKPAKRAQIHAYPIHIGINVYATKRDVLDFISKRWDFIRYMLDTYNEKPKMVKEKPKADRDDYIWANKELSAKKLAELVNKKFPDENLTYSDINSILYYLRQRKFSSQV